MFSLYKKEIQSFFFSPFAYVLSALFMLIFGFAFVNRIADMDSSVLQFSFPDMFYNNFFYFMFIIPLLTMRSFADERRGGTEVQLLTSPLTITQIVLAKFLSIVTVFLFMMLLSLFFPIYISLHGTVIWSSLICGYPMGTCLHSTRYAFLCDAEQFHNSRDNRRDRYGRLPLPRSVWRYKAGRELSAP